MSVINGSSGTGRKPTDFGSGGYNNQRRPLPTHQQAPLTAGAGSAEDEMINAMLAAESENWASTQDRMAS